MKKVGSSEEIINSEGDRTADREEQGHEQEDNVCLPPRFRGVYGVPAQPPELIPWSALGEGAEQLLQYLRTGSEVMPLYAKSRNQKDGDHQRRDSSLKPRGDAKPSEDHKGYAHESKERCCFWENDARGSNGMGPAQSIAHAAGKKAQTESHAQQNFDHDEESLIHNLALHITPLFSTGHTHAPARLI